MENLQAINERIDIGSRWTHECGGTYVLATPDGLRCCLIDINNGMSFTAPAITHDRFDITANEFVKICGHDLRFTKIQNSYYKY